ncbi:MipA/OmpV family protein [Pseudomonas citrulli]|uniref:MipA/OmpV family protein n=1 Tax=Pseudomonas citrulli TaxID=3064347 RepID=A0ABT9C0Q1_9PSED|nr:MipA/OmpV family protein [Pseudomonas sp. K18]MDO7898352.1 MipA/OmpV family protein [Pseudomonas sp. K18]
MSTSLRLLCVTSACLLLPASALRAEDWHYSLNAGVASAPRYSGATERAVAPLLGGEITSPGGFFLGTEKGLGWATQGDRFGFSIYVNGSAARKDRRSGFKGSDELNGMGSIKSRPLLGLDGSYHLGPLVLGANFEHAMEEDKDEPDTGSAYNRLKLSLSLPLYKGRMGEWVGSINSQFGDSDYLRTWYGVSEAQASRSQYHAYGARGGMFSRGAELTWKLPIDEHWSVSTVATVDYLANDAADSPIVERRLQSALATQVSYSF